MKQKQYILLIVFSLFLIHCGGSAIGGSEFGNPARGLKGLVVSAATGSLALKQNAANSNSCPADMVILTDSLLNTVSLEINSDCSFDDSIDVNQAYDVSFYKNDVFVASLEVTNGSSTLTTSIIYIADGSSDVDLGTITISGDKAIPENEAATQSDRDNDGVDDFDDDDDNNDGVNDEDETDCDLDGFFDEDDNSSECASDSNENSSGTNSTVLEVAPRNNSVDVNLDKEIEVRFGCDVKASSVTSSTLSITSNTETILCSFELDGNELQCQHDDNLFVSGHLYSATINGIKCVDGTVINTVTWSWTAK